MKSQSLTVDLTKETVGRLRTDNYLHRREYHGDVIVTSSIPEYPSMEKIQGRVIWGLDMVYKLNDPRDTARDLWAHQLFRKFAKATGSTISSIRHVENITYVDYKVKELANVEDMEWTSMELEVELNV